MEKALDILSRFTPAKSCWGITELSRDLKLPKSSIHRMVKTFEKKGFLRQRADSGEYEIGYRMLELTGALVGETEGLRVRAAPYLRHLHESLRCTVSLRVMEKDELVILDRIDTPQHLRVVFPVGAHLPCNHGAAGKLFLAFGAASRSIRDLVRGGKIKRLTDKTPTSAKLIDAELAKIRQKGYAISRGEAIPGVWGISAPVFDSNGHIRAALALTFAESLLPRNGIKRFISVLRQDAERLSSELGFQPRKTGTGQ